MNKTSKVCVAATLALGTLIGVTVVENSAPTSKQAQAAITPHYTYNGYIGNNANFILDKNFINAIKYDNVKFNGIKLAKTNTIKKVEKYDQTFKGVSAKGNEASQLQFVVKNNISLKDIQKAYGKDLKKENGKTKEADSGIFYYQNAKKTLGIWFVVDHNRVVEVTVGHTPYKTSK
ncbi:immunodominant staphylococcal antigen IsaB [Staphylococcus aureus]|uniref:immunodominant staphylococcal antigen IsaB n=1 Tax=Staphylococcus aureus TaxID=1280 RepID=UPI0018897261|nr:immunodominant staphylococcal antigen IsaB [Staphylococcus aureus]QOW92322.1 immunodominant staphylococcal antigen IsaB [Staphylococcus aureus]QOY75054.1 immunodominant staphylococcal antigen IsaB [Staphylococcus aureus]